MANTFETVSVPTALRVPGAVYCNNADCTGHSILSGRAAASAQFVHDQPDDGSDNLHGDCAVHRPYRSALVLSEGWQGFSGQNSFVEFGKRPFVAGENGGVRGEVIYARPVRSMTRSCSCIRAGRRTYRA